MNSLARSLTLALAAAALALVARADDRDVQTVKFSDPAKPGTFRAELPWANLKVRGTDAVEVRIVSSLPTKAKAGRRADGLRRLDDTPSFETAEKDNVVTLELNGAQAWPHGAEFEIEVPRRTALVLRTEAGGDLTVENVDGDVEICNMNGEVDLKGLAGSAIVNTQNGEISASYRVAPTKPVSLSSMNGEISLRLPADAKANLRLRTHNGSVYTDFDEAAMKTKTEGGGKGGARTYSNGYLGPEASRAIAQTTRDAVRIATEASRAAAEISRQVQHEVQRAVTEAHVEVKLAEQEAKRIEKEAASTGEAIAPPAPVPARVPKAPRFTGDFGINQSLIGGKVVSGTLNGGGPEIQISSVNGTITIRQAK